MGFHPARNGDFQSSLIALPNLPLTPPLGTRNILGCERLGDCPWHGTLVHNAAAGIADNANGAAGPAGPVARPVVVFTLYDFFTSIGAVTLARGAGANIVNMSYGAEVPASLSWSVVPFDLFTASMDAAGAILFAAAGNDGAHVDAEDCFIVVCWEEAWHTPCENNGVICVGALGRNSLIAAGFSNWGREDVDVFAPGVLLLGPTPEEVGNVAVAESGTSLASPYAAGVAALIWAAEPRLSDRDVERLLLLHARTDSPDGRVERYVHALGAVLDALPPLVNIETPANGITVPRGTTIDFRAFVHDGGRGVDSLIWRSNLDGEVGRGTSFSTPTLSLGTHTITATATFGDGTTATDTVLVTTTNQAPIVEIIDPTGRPEEVFQSETLTFVGQSFDPNEVENGFRLADAQVAWFLDSAVVPFATGHSVSRSFATLALGDHTVEFRGSDGLLDASDAILVRVLPDPADLPPRVEFVAPAHGSTFLADEVDATGRLFARVTLVGDVSDPEGGPLEIVWSDRVSGGLPQELGRETVPASSGTTRVTLPDVQLLALFPFGTSHDLRLTATDARGQSRLALVRVIVTNIS